VLRIAKGKHLRSPMQDELQSVDAERFSPMHGTRADVTHSNEDAGMLSMDNDRNG
jgi:hypothetical protein